MQFCKQIKLLLWKNFILRRRKWIRLCVEILWPIVMFSVLALLRLIGYREIIPVCNFKAKAMPTAGDVAFMQTFFCTFNNTCDDYFSSSFDVYNDSLITKLMTYISLTLNDSEVDEGKNKTETFSTEITYNSQNLDQITSQPVISNQTDDVLQIYPNTVTDNLRRSLERDDTYSIRNVKGLEYLDRLFCGKDIPPVLLQVLSLRENNVLKSRKQEIEKVTGSIDAIQLRDHYQLEAPEYEKDTTPFCNSFMRTMESKYEVRIIWRLFKPFMRGKIIYTPSNPATDRVMQGVNDTFSRVLDLNNYLKNLINSYQTTIELTQAVKNIHSFGRSINNDRNYEKTDLKQLYNYLECFDSERIIPVKKRRAAVKEAMKWLETERLWALVEFVNVAENATTLPTSVIYKIRTDIERTHSTFRIKDRIFKHKVRRHPIFDLKHITGGFAYLQSLVEAELIRYYTNRTHLPGIYLKQTPYPCYVFDPFQETVSRTFPLFMIVAWIFTFSILIKKIVFEKERRLKETMKMMGLENVQHWIAWFLDSFIVMSFVTLIMSFILKFGNVVSSSSWSVVWVFLLLYIVPTVSLAFLISTLFSRASIAAAVAGLTFFILFLPYPTISQFQEDIDPTFKLISCLISNVAFGLGCTWIADMEGIGEGAQWFNLNVSVVPGNPITMAIVFAMFILDSCIYLLLAFYIETVFPGEHGVGRPYYFLFTRSYWCGHESNLNDSQEYVVEREDKDPRRYEPEPNLAPGVSVDNLTKKYPNGKIAVDRLSLKFYENQITCFLGHNGAGKTTTISILTGLIPPTSGIVLINGLDLRYDKDVIRRSLGVCPQYNVLFDELTVEEHLLFFGRLKGQSLAETKIEAYEMIKNLSLESKILTQVRYLSGGMKRKVSVAVAFIGGSKIIFLDEPTSGVDPYSRRAIWDLLVKYKKGRTIILTTHLMDEADLLGDRIAIIAKGHLMCCGTSSFLKTHFGRGYYLTIESNFRSQKVQRFMKKGSVELESGIGQHIQKLTNSIQSIMPSAIFLEHIGTDIVFILPCKDNIALYERIFTFMDSSKEELNIISYGVSDTTLEEIFLSIAVEAEHKFPTEYDDLGVNNRRKCYSLLCRRKEVTEETEILDYVSVHQAPVNELHDDERRASSDNTSSLFPTPPYTLTRQRRQLIWIQFTALMKKRLIHHTRNYKALVVLLVVPPVFITAALVITSFLPGLKLMPPIIITPDAYGSTIFFYSQNNSENPRLASYERELLSPYGYGTKCVLSPEQCSLKEIPRGSLVSHENNSDNSGGWECPDGKFKCRSNMMPPNPPEAVMSNGDTLVNLTGWNISDWLVKTEYRTSTERYGGVTFGYRNLLNSYGVMEFLHTFQADTFLPFILSLEPADLKNTSMDEVAQLLMQYVDTQLASSYIRDQDWDDNIIIWFNSRGWIAPVAYMNAIHNLILRASLPQSADKSKYSITLINHPLPITRRQLEDELDKQSNISLLRALAMIYALAFIPAIFIVYLVEERSSGLKHLQMIAGVERPIYWFTTILWDLILYSLTLTVIVLVFVAFQEKTYSGEDSIFPFIILLLLYGWVSITSVYPLSFLFSVSSAAFISVATLNIFFGMITLLTDFVLSLSSRSDDPYHLDTIFLIFPQFCLGKALMNMAVESITCDTAKKFDAVREARYFDWNVTGKYMLVMTVLGLLFFLVTLLIQFRFCVFWTRSRKEENLKKYLKLDEENLEDDVETEKKRVLCGIADKEKDVLIVKNLTKIYSGAKSPAVKRVCVGIRGGECFGLLGLNGAGKTTFFKMLTGDTSITVGNAFIQGVGIRRKKKVVTMIGYCPQFDALDPYLTPVEHLKFFCRLRGVDRTEQPKMVIRAIEEMALTKYADKQVRYLSGGNKRKLNTAIAFIGKPDLILLDEPTSGMDVKARRYLWSCVQKEIRDGRCVILTSHSMEECQALCSQLSIMVNGRFTCFGTLQHLKHKYDSGYQLTVGCRKVEDVENVKGMILETFPRCTTVDSHYTRLKFQLATETRLSIVFPTLERMKETKLIGYYSLAQTSLEQIFLKFAEEQQVEGEKISSRHFWCSCCGKKTREKADLDNQDEAKKVSKEKDEDHSSEREEDEDPWNQTMSSFLRSVLKLPSVVLSGQSRREKTGLRAGSEELEPLPGPSHSESDN